MKDAENKTQGQQGAEAAKPQLSQDFSGLGGDAGRGAATWIGTAPPPLPKRRWWQYILAGSRLLLLALSTALLLPVFFVSRFFGSGRSVVALWCRVGTFCCGLRARRIGKPMTGGGVLLSNHIAWIDILVLGSMAPVHFVAKAEVATWPLFGWLARITDTAFIERRRAQAKAQQGPLAERVSQGQLLTLFPEGTSSDGLRVLPFKSSLFSMFFDADGKAAMPAQPVSICYLAPSGLPDSFYGWWGEMSLFDHILDVTALSWRGEVVVTFHPPLDAASCGDRKTMASAAQAAVEQGVLGVLPDRA
ncbi:MAG: 1-acyl-sn-glycerol-3-phosphate acyltransferase [Neomegalonema sp.]|nr:1-acyl-sn-glycerol-3-phosphate acyltransferase [Neomegalonema sp.]